MASTLMASQTLVLCNPNLHSPIHNNKFSTLSLPSTLKFSKPIITSFPPSSLHTPKPKKLTISASSSTLLRNPPAKLPKTPIPADPLLTGSTRTISTLVVITLTASKLLLHKFLNLGSHGLGKTIVYSAGPMFFAAMRSQASTGALNTPLTVVAAGMAKWLDIYSGVLMVRVLLSWFPNIPWDRQPLSAIRDLCDPYLNLFRNIIPPIFDTLDVSPLLAFAVLGTLGSILNSSRGTY